MAGASPTRRASCATAPLRVLSTGVMTRGITDCGVAIGAAAALALGAWRVSHGVMSIQALLIVLMAGTEVFRPLRDLRMVLHQGMVGQSAAAGINALLAAKPLVPRDPANLPPAQRLDGAHDRLRRCPFRLSRRTRRRP